ncbi:MAG: phage terminase large subunit family protein [Gemmatimonadaceae bacterium]|nr:phage terminase large subunit family protein [Gemmatimonadaceae bacterium]
MTAAPTTPLYLTVPGLALGDADALYRDARSGYAPRTPAPAAAWAERHYRLSTETGATPGQYLLDRTPYWRAIFEVLERSETQEVVVMKSSQVGFTEVLMAYLAWIICEDPGPTMWVRETLKAAKQWSRTRLKYFLRDNKAVRRVLYQTVTRRRESTESLLEKYFEHGHLIITGANNPEDLASNPIRRVILDELDRHTRQAGAEGSPYDIVRKRLITYGRHAKLVAGGSPTELEASLTYDLFLAGTQEHWVMPCPFCGHEQPFLWRGDQALSQEGAYRLVAERAPDGTFRPETAAYVCRGCAALIPERPHKPWMIERGRFVPTFPGRAIRSFHTWAALSPWLSWGQILADFERSRGTPEQLQVFINTIAGLPFAPPVKRHEPGALMARAEAWGGRVPAPVGLLTAGVDVQQDRLEVVLWGWGANEAGFALEWHQIDGDPHQPDTWARLDTILWRERDGLTVALACVDAGYLPGPVWKWLETQREGPAIGVVGRDGRGKPLIAKPGPDRDKRAQRNWVVGSDTAKYAIASRLAAAPDAYGHLRFADALPLVFYEQLTAERLKLVPTPRPHYVWELIPHRRNEVLDCTQYALAALHALGPETIAALGAFAAQRAALAAEAGDAAASAAAAALDDPDPDLTGWPGARRSSYVRDWSA